MSEAGEGDSDWICFGGVRDIRRMRIALSALSRAAERPGGGVLQQCRKGCCQAEMGVAGEWPDPALRDAQKSLLLLCSLSPLLLLSLFYGGYFVCDPDPANKLSGFFIAAVILCSILETGAGFPSCFLLPLCIPSDDICKAVQNCAKQALLLRQSWRRLFLYSSAFEEYVSAERQSPMVSWLLLPKAFAVFLMRFLRIQISARYPDAK